MQKVRILIITCLVAAMFVGDTAPAQAETWDLAAQWSDTTATNGVWTYGYADVNYTNITPFTLQTDYWFHGDEFSDTQDVWYRKGQQPIPALFKSVGVSRKHDIPQGRIGGHGDMPHLDDKLAVVQWTAPYDTTITISGGTWQPTERTREVTVSLLVKGTVLFKNVKIPIRTQGYNSITPYTFAQAIESYGSSANQLQNISVKKNDTVLLGFGHSPGNESDYFGVDFTITGTQAQSVDSMDTTVPSKSINSKTLDDKKVGETKSKKLSEGNIIAFTFVEAPPLNGNPKKISSLTFLSPASSTEWKYWRNRGVVPAVSVTWHPLLINSSVEKASDLLINLDYRGDPNPVVCIDEFGFDQGGDTDQRIAKILEETKRKKPELALTVWQMRGPVPQVLAEAYRKYVDLILLESYVGDKRDYWWIISQVYAARMHGLMHKTIVALGLGYEWARTKEELEQQIRFVRLIAPESPGIGFFAPHATPELLAYADELCSRFFQIPTDGSGLPQDVIELHKTFSESHEKPTLVCSPFWVQPNRDPKVDPNILIEPRTMRAYILNLGENDARNVKMRLRATKEAGGEIFAEGVVSVVPKRTETVAVLPMMEKWKIMDKAALQEFLVKVWNIWELEVESPGSEVLIQKLQLP